jgi:hypothetical protein
MSPAGTLGGAAAKGVGGGGLATGSGLFAEQAAARAPDNATGTIQWRVDLMGQWSYFAFRSKSINACGACG